MSFKIWRPYEYTGLTHPEDIRLVILHPKEPRTHGSEEDHDISIEITRVRLDHCEYEALSYAWGDTTPCIEINVGHDFQSLKITRSLYVALKHLRGMHKRFLWVDALSINQGDLVERAAQVKRMGAIYQKAQTVIVWLGEGDNTSDMAFSFMESIILSDLNAFDMEPDTSLSWLSLCRLMRRPWFGRRWILQEVAFARKVNLQCGNKSIDWSDFAEAETLLAEICNQSTATNRGQGLLIRRSEWEHEFPNDQSQSRGGAAHTLVKIMGQMLRKREGQDPELLWTTERLLSELTVFQATDPHDVLYAIASLSKDSILGIVPDYLTSVLEVWIHLIYRVASASRSLNILCQPWAPELPDYSPAVPSFICPSSRVAIQWKVGVIYQRVNADTLVGNPGKRIYRAGGSSPPKIRDPISADLVNNKMMIVNGFILTTMAWIGDAATDGLIPATWLNSLSESGFGRDWLIDTFWRVLVANRGPDGELPPSWYRRAWAEVCDELGQKTVDTTALLELWGETNGPHDLEYVLKCSFLRRMQAVIWNRRLAIFQNKCVGLVPAATNLGDRVVILYSCDVPLICRQEFFGSSIIGEVYMHGHGVMEGDACDRPHQEMVFYII